ncbi:hypothetical protein ACFX11_007188 [Malus domestica]
MSSLLSPITPLTVTLSHSSKPLLHLHAPFLFSLNHHHSSLTKSTTKLKPRRPLTTTQSKGTDDSVDAPNRLISVVCYFYPFFDGSIIVLDLLLIFPELLERSFNPKDWLGLDSTVFLFLLVCLVYGSASCVLGQVPRLPIVPEAAGRQVP